MRSDTIMRPKVVRNDIFMRTKVVRSEIIIRAKVARHYYARSSWYKFTNP